MDQVPPAPGWYADPAWPAGQRWWDGYQWTGHVQPPAGPRLPVLDATVARLRREAPARWGRRPVLVPLAVLVALIAVTSTVLPTVEPSEYATRLVFTVAVNVGIDGLLAVAVWRAAGPVAAAHGGWAATFGLYRPRWVDLGYAGVGIAVTFALRIAVIGVADALSSGRAGRQAQNLHLHHLDPAGIILIYAAVVVWAPIAEELLFRGVLLRAFMRRSPFWPAAVLSTAIFAVLHVYEVHTALGAATLAASVACLGLVNCYLNRLTDRLVPGMIVHAAFNLLAVTVLLAQAN